MASDDPAPSFRKLLKLVEGLTNGMPEKSKETAKQRKQRYALRRRILKKRVVDGPADHPDSPNQKVPKWATRSSDSKK